VSFSPGGGARPVSPPFLHLLFVFHTRQTQKRIAIFATFWEAPADTFGLGFSFIATGGTPTFVRLLLPPSSAPAAAPADLP